MSTALILVSFLILSRSSGLASAVAPPLRRLGTGRALWTDGDAGQSLIEMHGVVLFAISVEAHQVVLSVELAHAMLHLMNFRVQTAEHAFEGEDEIEAACLVVEPVQLLFSRRHNVPGARHR